MRLKLLLWIIIVLGIPNNICAQDKIVFDGADLSFQTLEDYENYEEKILVLVHWLKTHSFNHKDWKKGELVFLKWIRETPSL